MAETKFTPGPWRWELNEAHKRIQLCGGGKTPYDLIVMDFIRYGMQGAQPRFIDGKDRDELNLNVMYPASDFGVAVKGREHHSNWFKGINHPDAHLIAATPDMYEALSNVKHLFENTLTESGTHLYNKYPEAYAHVTAALSKASPRHHP